MSEQDLNLFTRPIIYDEYCRKLIYSLTTYQIRLFEDIILFNGNINTLIEKKRALITFIDNNPQYQSNNYASICYSITIKGKNNAAKNSNSIANGPKSNKN